jgi:ribonuclease-3
LQEISQARDGFTPVYKVLTEDGPDHEKTFTLGVFVGEKKMGEGSGPSKQIAQQDAAKAAIKAYKAAKRKK